MTEETDAPVADNELVEADAEQLVESEDQVEEPAESSTEKPKGVQKRIDELTRIRRETERDRDYWRELALQNKPEPAQEPKPEPVQRKTLEEFDYDQDAYLAYQEERILQEAENRARKASQAAQAEATRNQRLMTFLDREQEFSSTVDDYMSLTRSPAFPFTGQFADVVMESEVAPELTYYLAKNTALAQKLATMPPTSMAREIGRIEAKVLADRQKPAPVTKAPPPPPKIDAVSDVVDKDPEKMSTDEWLAYRRKQLAKR